MIYDVIDLCGKRSKIKDLLVTGEILVHFVTVSINVAESYRAGALDYGKIVLCFGQHLRKTISTRGDETIKVPNTNMAALPFQDKRDRRSLIYKIVLPFYVCNYVDFTAPVRIYEIFRQECLVRGAWASGKIMRSDKDGPNASLFCRLYNYGRPEADEQNGAIRAGDTESTFTTADKTRGNTLSKINHCTELRHQHKITKQ
ncbi:hypothetical protein TcasGA2_TC007611 [Tribolium castaneum]|uniref:Uncharacterized protein n=1 Tax=Tribolium castaneum TaxID=7070 RepID=D2A2X3_TRICA|nr:hypothetical protein TcasGA2_TC007611 [Tribolium castaneum]